MSHLSSCVVCSARSKSLRLHHLMQIHHNWNYVIRGEKRVKARNFSLLDCANSKPHGDWKRSESERSTLKHFYRATQPSAFPMFFFIRFSFRFDSPPTRQTERTRNSRTRKRVETLLRFQNDEWTRKNIFGLYIVAWLNFGHDSDRRKILFFFARANFSNLGGDHGVGQRCEILFSASSRLAKERRTEKNYHKTVSHDYRDYYRSRLESCARSARLVFLFFFGALWLRNIQRGSIFELSKGHWNRGEKL